MDLEHPSLSSEKGSEGWRASVQKDIDGWRSKASDYRKDTDKIEEDARKLEDKAEKLREHSKHTHHIGNYYDLGELAIEMGLVLCSIALISKERKLWYGSMGVSGIGTLLMIVGLVQQYLVH
jgi:hypothetical protein